MTEAALERLSALRLLIVGFASMYLLVRAPYFASASRARGAFAPVGFASILRAELPVSVSWLIAIAAVALGVTFAAGRVVRVAGPLFALGLLWLTTYASSWGKILHHENLLVLHTSVLAFVFAVEPRPRVASAKSALGALRMTTALTYFVAGVTKLRAGASGWLSGEALGDWLAWDALRKIELGSLYSPLGPLLAAHASATQILAILTLLMELGAPLALLSRRFATVWILAAWTFHAGVLAAMVILFFYPLSGLAFAPWLPVERLPFVRRLVASEPSQGELHH